MEVVVIIIYASIQAMTPLLIAGVGELIVEKSGCLNLGVEGMMLIGCVAGFIVSINSGSLLLGFVMAALAGLLMALLFAILSVLLRTNQVATGLALTIFAVGLSSFLGLNYVGKPLNGLQFLAVPIVADIPIIGKLLFQHDIITYFAVVSLAGCWWFLHKSRLGLILIAVGENHQAAFSMGYSVIKVRFLALLFGGAMAGIAGGYLSLVYTPLWSEQMTAGRGWIVLALVVFSTWKPLRLLAGAWLFGLVSIAQLFLQGSEDAAILSLIPTEFFSMLPYLVTIVVLVIIHSSKAHQSAKRIPTAPANLGIPFEPR